MRRVIRSRLEGWRSIKGGVGSVEKGDGVELCLIWLLLLRCW